MKQKILILSFSDLNRDPRVYRQIASLAEAYEVTAAGYQDPQLQGVQFIDVSCPPQTFLSKCRGGLRLLSRRYEAYYWGHPRTYTALQRLQHIETDLIIANDIEALPIALKIAGKAKVIYDAHEYSPCEFEDLFLWRLFYQKYKIYLCQTYLQHADDMLTVSSNIANAYLNTFQRKSKVLTNAPEFVNLSPKSVDASKIRLVCHSSAMPSRKLEQLIELFAYLDDRFTLDFILVPQSKKHFKKLQKMASQYPQIRFLPPVPTQSITRYLNPYDIGVYLLPPSNFNNAQALPNKFFEFIQARLAVAIGPSPEMKKIVKQYSCGLVSKDFSAKQLAYELMQLDKTSIEHYKQHSHRAAEELCAEKNRTILVDMVKNLLEDS